MSQINEILEIVRLNEYYFEKSRMLSSEISKMKTDDTNFNTIVLEEKECRVLSNEIRNEAVLKIEEAGSYYTVFKILLNAIESGDVLKEIRIRTLIKKRFNEKQAR